MRRISFGLAAVAFVLAACGGEEAAPPKTPAAPVETAPAPVAEAPKAEEPKKAQPSMAEMQMMTGKSLGEAINAHDAKKLSAYFTENAVMRMAGAPADVTGREAIAANWQKLFDTFSGFKTMSTRTWSKGDVVVVEWAWTGTHTGDMMGVKATQKPVGTMGVDVMWFAPDGMIKEQHTYMDMGTLMSQIGVSKQKARSVPSIPSTPPVMVASTGSAEETKNVEATSKMLGAFEKKSETDFVGSTADDVTWDDMTQAETMKGKAAGKKYFTEMTKAFPDAKSTTVNAWGVGDFVIAETTMSGTHKGAFFGIQPTKKTVNLHNVDIMQFKDGKVAKGWSYGNGAELMTQLGLMPAMKDPKDAKDAKAAPAKTDAKPATPAPAKK